MKNAIISFPARAIFVHLFRLICVFLLGASGIASHAQDTLDITVTGSGGAPLQIIVPVFENEGSLPNSVSEVVRADLERSGLFKLIDLGPLTVPESRVPDLAAMAARGADAVLAASVVASPDGRYEIRFRLFDATRAADSKSDLGGMALKMSSAHYRITGHRIADFIYEKLTGIPGYFATRIAYVVKNRQRYELHIADSDGMNAQTALRSPESIISPAWSPDGQQIAYVSFEAQKPVIYVHALATGQRRVLANFKGSNSAPAWAPDGRRLAVVLTKDGLSQLYVINADGSGARRLATSPGIDTEPAWSSDGQSVYFTSDRNGAPQIYRLNVSSGSVERITFESAYNVSPRPSADGKRLAFITNSGGHFRVAVMDLSSRQTTILTDSSRDESPSFAPNSNMILYATEVGGKGMLSAVSADGRVRQRLSIQAADVREPAWGPLQK
ncbi:MAG: Tol-Pal system beta propeller repeat protein TolB [Azoarcus sp.]|jgi:TolB protein|nr:Tol-Pal system beta propeller repeat protein TolB [Azoarcus sp.]